MICLHIYCGELKPLRIKTNIELREMRKQVKYTNNSNNNNDNK